MNEPIMRRGLSPEGRRIRQRHQGSLLNDEFGVTSQPVQKKIEKDFLKGNVMRLREIQAKCRTQESRPLSGSQPVKAIRPRIAALPLHHTKDAIVSTEGKNSTLKLREGSAHSDYFSLSDEAQNETVQTPSQSNFGVFGESLKGTEQLSNGDFVTKDSNPHSSTDNLENNPLPLLIEKCDFPNNIPFKSPKSLPRHNEADSNGKCVNTSSKFADFYPHSHSLRRSKIGNVIERIKSKKPACDTNTDVIWRDIEKEHKAFFTDEAGSSLNTPRTLFIGNQKCGNLPPNSKSSSCRKKTITAPRSQSLDRSSHYKANPKSIPLHNSTCTLLPRPKSSSTNLIDLKQNLKINALPSSQDGVIKEIDSPSVQSGSLPNFSEVNGTEMMNPDSSRRHLSPSPPHSFSLNASSHSGTRETSCCEEDTFHFKDRPDTDREVSDTARNSIANQGDVCSSLSSESNADVTEESGRKILSFIPAITKRDVSVQTPKRVIPSKPMMTPLLRSKSSSNLQLTRELPPTYKKGQVPKYLKSRKAEAQRRLEAAAAVDPLCPPRHTSLPDHERRNTLHLLKKGQADVMRQLSALPLSQDTLRIRKLKQDLETKLAQIEEGIDIFSQPKVYVVNDE